MSHVLSLLHRRHPVTMQVNSFAMSVPNLIIHHYDVVISPSEKTLPARMTMDLIRRLQFDVVPQIFTLRCVYDPRKNSFSIHRLKFDTGLQDGKGPKVYKIKLTHVAEINPEDFHCFIEGKGSPDDTVLTAITVSLNVVIRMQPKLSYPFNVRPFFTDRETNPISTFVSLIFVPTHFSLDFATLFSFIFSVSYSPPPLSKKPLERLHSIKNGLGVLAYGQSEYVRQSW
ncbi:hypothetical protein B0H14DRAFT_3547897 [Mycena olivaceomarginata]|nr:hypothetical protein B0H14DRAFT_3547897 [Mycena olivaceomarginata]